MFKEFLEYARIILGLFNDMFQALKIWNAAHPWLEALRISCMILLGFLYAVTTKISGVRLTYPDQAPQSLTLNWLYAGLFIFVLTAFTFFMRFREMKREKTYSA